MRAKFWIIAITIIATGLIAWLDYSHTNSFKHAQQNVQIISKPAPDFSFTPLGKDSNHTLADFKGKTVLINFWASWCEPCIHEYPMLVELAAKHPDTLVLIMLSSDKTAKDAHRFSQNISTKLGMDSSDNTLFANLPNVYVAWDEGKTITRETFGTTRYPESILIGPDGQITQKIIGVVTEENINEIERVME